MAISIKGVIGVDITGAGFAEKMSRIKGDVTFEIDSPGGSVFHGISIFNAIKNYKGGKCTMHVVGDCSSMAAYIMLAGDGPVQFEPNSIVVLHNPWSFAVGDYKEMQKEADILERMAKLYAKEFVKRGIFEEKEIRSIMDAETWFIGAEQLKRLGTVLEDNNSENNDDETVEIKMAACRERIKEAQSKIKAFETNNNEKIVAMLPNFEEPKAQVQPENQTKVLNSMLPKEEKGEKTMVKDLNELKAQFPSIYEEAKQEGVKAEQKRVNSFMKFIDVDRQATLKAISDGVGLTDDEFQASILLAKTTKASIKALEDENPPQVDPQTETHAKEGEEEGASADDEAKAKAEAEAKKYNAIISAMGLEVEKK